MNYELLVNTAVLAGEIMLSGGAETYRVEDTMRRMLKVSNLENAETMVTTTYINVTLSDKSINTITYIKRVTARNANLERIYEVNELSRKFCEHAISLEEAHERLQTIATKQSYNGKLMYLATITTAAFFTVLYGGNLLDSLVGAVNGAIIAASMLLFRKLQVNLFIVNMVSSILVTTCAILFYNYFTPQMHLTILISGSITPLVPGVAITNAIRDTFQGDYVSGVARAIEAFVAATAISVGVGLVLALFKVYVMI